LTTGENTVGPIFVAQLVTMILCVIDNSIFSGEIEMIGKTLVHYEITAEIGKGGMGEVYQAKDTKLGRDVAIKVLPEEFALDTDRVARFQREAKLLASLNHPNIAAIYGLEESDGTHFLVMELIEGDTLSDRIKSGPIPVEEALKLALQMAEALEAAHEKGVIHRDLKPANIKVTPDGNVKILDFGLAKAYAGDQENMSPMDSPTISAAATQQGVILGTAAYMSPEQARGKPVDRRADIWAFGVVLYEMLTGKTAFQGEDVSVTLASVITSDANLTLLPPNIHPRVREVINRCLQKESKKRYSGISDVQYEIEQALSDPSGVFLQPSVLPKPKKQLQLGIPLVAFMVVLCLVAAGVAVWFLKPIPPHEPKQVMRFEYELPEGQQFSPSTTDLPLLTISLDGSKIVYSTAKGLFLRSLKEMDARFIAGTDGTSIQPFFSPDGQWIAYWSGTDRKLKKVAVSGGAPMTLCDAEPAGGFSWSLDNRILHGESTNILWVSANGGNWEPLFELESGLLGVPQMLPGGESVLFLDGITSPGKIMVHSLKSGESKELLVGVFAQYVKTGHIVYGVENNLHAVPFDVDTLEVIGGPVSLIEGVLNTQYFWQDAVSDSGTLVYVPGGSLAFSQRTFVWVDREGKEDPLGAGPNSYEDYFRISPDGTRVAWSTSESGNEDIWIWDLARENKTRLTFDATWDLEPIWTPDSRRIIYNSGREGRVGIFWKAADGSGKAEKIATLTERDIAPRSISADGKTLFLVEDGGERSNNVGMLNMESDRAPELLFQERYRETDPMISPDGKWLAYTSNESGQWEVFICPFPDVEGGGRWQVSTNGGDWPLWSPDGKELYYRHPDAIMAVSVETEPTLRLGRPISLFANRYVGGFDIHPDGERFLMLKPFARPDGESKEGITPKINIVLNWIEELKERVPVD
jgi:serine/threonine protein kinase